MELLDFPDAKISAAVILGARALDPQNRNQILDALDFESDKKAVKKSWR